MKSTFQSDDTLSDRGELASPEIVGLPRTLSGHLHQLWSLFFGGRPPSLIQALLFEAMALPETD
jgi:hypothetical protein